MTLFTIHYDGITDEPLSNAQYDEAERLWYEQGKRCDIIEVPRDDLHDAYEYAVDNSDHLLSISYLEFYSKERGEWVNWHEWVEGVAVAMQGVVKNHIKSSFITI